MPTYNVLELVRAAKVYVKNHQGHHPTKCIDGCDRDSCGAAALADAVHAIEGKYAKRQEELPYEDSVEEAG